MVAAIIAYPQLVTGGIDEGVKIDADKALQEMTLPSKGAPEVPALPGAAPGSTPGTNDPLSPPKKDDADDKMKGLMDAIKSDAASDKKP
jgi:hypothetical protein